MPGNGRAPLWPRKPKGRRGGSLSRVKDHCPITVSDAAFPFGRGCASVRCTGRARCGAGRAPPAKRVSPAKRTPPAKRVPPGVRTLPAKRTPPGGQTLFAGWGPTGTWAVPAKSARHAGAVEPARVGWALLARACAARSFPGVPPPGAVGFAAGSPLDCSMNRLLARNSI